MLIYFDKQGTADNSRVHNKTDWYILKTQDSNVLTDDNVHWRSVNDTIDINKKITNFSLTVDDIGWIYVVLHFSNGDTEEMPLREVTPNDFKTYLVHSNVINVEPVRLRVVENTINVGGNLKLVANPIRPRSAVFGKLYITIYNRANMKIFYTASSSLEVTIPVTELKEYLVGERLYIRYHMTSTAGISSMSQETIVVGYDNLPNLSFKTNFIDSSMDLLLGLEDENYIIKTWWLSNNGKPIVQGNSDDLVITNNYLEYGTNYNLRLQIKKNGEPNVYDITKTIATSPKRETYDINNDYVYKEIQEVQGNKLTNNIMLSEELFTGSILLQPSNKLLFTGVNSLDKSGSVYEFNDVIINGNSIGLTVDNYRNIIIDSNNIHVFRTDYASGTSVLENSFAKPTQGFCYTINYTDKSLYTIVGTNLVRMDLTNGSLTSKVDLKTVNSKTKIVYMGYDRILIIGGEEKVRVYTPTTGRLDLVERLPLEMVNDDITVMLGMDGNPIIYDKTNFSLRQYIVKDDMFKQVPNSSILANENITNIYRLRNGSIRFIGENKIFNFK